MGKPNKFEEKLNTVLGQESDVEGNIKVKGGIRVDGYLRGELQVEGSLFVGKTGTIEGEIRAKTAVIGGRLKGKVKIEETIEFLSGSRFEGELLCKGLIVQEGVKFDGTCNMDKEVPEPKKEILKEEEKIV